MFRSIENQMIKEIVWENSITFHSRSRNDPNCFQIIAQLSMFHLVYFDRLKVFNLIILKEGGTLYLY